MTTAPGTRPSRGPAAGVLAPLARRRSLPHLLAGAVLVVAAALAVSMTVSRLDDRVPVVVVAQPVAAGQLLTATDLATARVSVNASAATVPAARRADLVGRVALVPLAAGALLAPGQVGSGPAGWPPAGQAITALPVLPDRTPDGLVTGARVQILVSPQTSAVGADPATPPDAMVGVVQAAATVMAVADLGDQVGGQVVSLLLPQADATRLAAAAGDVSIVLLAPGGGS